MSKALGWVLLVLGLAVAGYGVAQAAGGDLPSMGPADSPVGWAVPLVVGLVFLVVALVLITRPPAMAPAAAQPAPQAAAPEAVEVKRTEMRWGEKPAAEETAATSEIEEMRQKLARLKVQYGLGEISAESYRRVSADLEAKLAELEKAQLEGG